jgi:hypothetical protein
VPAFPLFRILPDSLKVPLHIQISRSNLPSPPAYFTRNTIEKPPESFAEVLEEPRGKAKTADRAIAVGTVRGQDKCVRDAVDLAYLDKIQHSLGESITRNVGSAQSIATTLELSHSRKPQKIGPHWSRSF